ncbi:DNA double-strand break repair rad50 ATPase, putative [Babesia caballi]|uniref:DNA double-strand break repair rad50 ATPase, putative n=1 Tax=Babesia caballi TaxID=5871 RepID=A0AAV4LZ71_BABCB|nr:DNA double-strand break repair rad50 ATPase, putative [Babesia caballi]
MFPPLQRRFYSTGLDVFVRNVNRYRLLSAEDKRKLLGAHRLKGVPESTVKSVESAIGLGTESASVPSPASATTAQAPASRLIAAELQRLKGRASGSGRLQGRSRPIGVGVSQFFMGIDPNTPPEPYDITSPLFGEEREADTLVADVQKAAAYDDIQSMLASVRPTPQGVLTDRFIDVMARAIEHNLSRIERPVLCNELSDFQSSYAMQRATLRNLLVNRCTRNAFDETRVERFLDRLRFSDQRLDAPLPPEVLEPLVAFRGLASYSFDPCTRLSQKLHNMQRLVRAIVDGDEPFLRALGTFAECSAGPPSKYPFRNYYGFESAVPSDVTGSIRMGKPRSAHAVRYHNLQAVAHSLPADRKYRAIVAHAIRVLERSKGWDQASKVKAVSRLVQVYNNLAPSRYYARVLDQAIPRMRTKGSTVRTRSRQETFNRGLQYIQSLTRNHWMKRK